MKKEKDRLKGELEAASNKVEEEKTENKKVVEAETKKFDEKAKV